MPTLFDKMFFEHAVHTDSMPPFAKETEKARSAGEMVTFLVAAIKNPVTMSNPRLRAIGELMWDMIGNNMVPCATHPNLSEVHFGCEITPQGNRAIVLVPVNFAEKVKQDCIYSIGAMLFIGSQIKDYYNDRFPNSDEVLNRARATEAEFLFFIKGLNIGYPFNEYQTKIMEAFPNGLEGVWYESKPFVKGEPLVKVPNPQNN